MNARTKMLQENTALGITALDDAQHATLRNAARVGAELVLKSALRALETFGSPSRYLDAVNTRLPSDEERRVAVKLAQAASLVEAKVKQLETTLRDNSAVVTQIEKHQLELSEAEKSLGAALEQRERLPQRDTYERAEHLADFKVAMKAKARTASVQQTDCATQDERDELLTPEGELNARVRAYERFAKRQMQLGIK